MSIILGILLALAIIYRIYISLKNLIRILLNPKFYIASLILYLYVKIGLKILSFTDKIFNTIFPYSSDENFFVELINIIFYLSVMGIIIYILGKIYYKASQRNSSLMLPIYFMLILLSLGAIAFKVYNMTSNSSNNNREFVDPHWVNGYKRKDGTFVNGYWRDGDGNTNINLDKEHGGGYYRWKS
ncbi:hypothetical protein FDN13_05210 [Caloramator sp. E03]|uniref:hypothetical protein n=1 Tax=Caloramator sp. E03 TaxID=2576307 RepID=UPI0011107589|nr:hypothetical protein [Caloramator sp. E03]QCX33146.1 hypothetical protein FDN13_05210 [Caloramator sp. E03]